MTNLKERRLSLTKDGSVKNMRVKKNSKKLVISIGLISMLSLTSYASTYNNNNSFNNQDYQSAVNNLDKLMDKFNISNKNDNQDSEYNSNIKNNQEAEKNNKNREQNSKNYSTSTSDDSKNDIQPKDIDVKYKKKLKLKDCGFSDDIYISKRNDENSFNFIDFSKASKNYELDLGIYVYKLKRDSSKVGYIIVSGKKVEYRKGLTLSNVGLNNMLYYVKAPDSNLFKLTSNDELLGCGTYEIKNIHSMNGKSFKIKVQPPEISKVETNYRSGLSLSDISLDNGWKWEKDFYLRDAGVYNFKVVYRDPINGGRYSKHIELIVNKGSVPRPKIDKITYNPYTRLRDISLPMGFTWRTNPDTIPQSGVNIYYADYNPVLLSESRMYKAEHSIPIKVTVEKANPTVYSWAVPVNGLIYGNKLSQVALSVGSASIPGFFEWKDGDIVPTVRNDGYILKFKPCDPNYRTLEYKIPVAVYKDLTPRYSDSPVLKRVTNNSIEVKKVPGNEYSMDNGKTWQDSNIFTNLQSYHYYDIVTRVKDCENTTTGHNSSAIRVVTKMDGPAAPDAPEFIKKTNHSIEVKKVENQEYSVDGGKTWDDSAIIKNLSGSTTYDVITRIKETESRMPSEPSKPITVKTKSFFRNLYDNVCFWR